MKYVSIARIEVDHTKNDKYKEILKDEIESSLSIEKEVKVLYPVWDKSASDKLTILEVYDASLPVVSSIFNS